MSQENNLFICKDGFEYKKDYYEDENGDYTTTLELIGAKKISSFSKNASTSGKIVIPEECDGYKVKSIARRAFAYLDGITEVVLPDTIINIDKETFRKCSALKIVKLPKNITEIPADMFCGCESLTDIVIPYGVTHIESGAFERCLSLTNISIPDSVVNIGSFSFFGCVNLRNITLPKKIKYIKSETFYNCSSLTTITIPDNVWSIGRQAFFGCENLKEAIFPQSEVFIRDDAFDGCSSLILNGMKFNGVPNIKTVESIEKLNIFKKK